MDEWREAKSQQNHGGILYMWVALHPGSRLVCLFRFYHRRAEEMWPPQSKRTKPYLITIIIVFSNLPSHPLHFSSSLSFSEDRDFSSFLSLNRVTMPPVTQDRTVCGRTGSWWGHFKMTNATNMSNINSSILLDTGRTRSALNIYTTDADRSYFVW